MVMGRLRRDALERVLLGGVAGRVVRAAPSALVTTTRLVAAPASANGPRSSRGNGCSSSRS